MKSTKKTYFTLIEMVIATSILLLLVLSISLVLRQILKSQETQKERSFRMYQLTQIKHVVGAMAKSAFLFEWQNEDGEKETFFMAERERMRLVYRIPVRSFDEGALRFAEISLDSEGQLVCDYQDRPWNFFDEDMAENSFRSVLAEDVESIEFAYVLKEVDLNEVNLEWVDSFSELEIIDRLPAGVRLRVTWNNGDSENFFWRVAGESQFEHSQEMRRLLPQ